MFLLTAVSEVFLLLGWVWQSDCLCSPTTFYKNCWIRRFPGLGIDLEQSQQRGAHLLKVYTEATAQQCSRTCCLMKNGFGTCPAHHASCTFRSLPRLLILFSSHGLLVFNFQTKNNSVFHSCSSGLEQVSCNLAVFDHETNNQRLNCLHVYCPALESCILKPRLNVVLYNITPGIDPDLLVFDKLSFKDLNTRSSLNKWERHGSARIADSEKCQDATTSSSCLPPETSPSTVAYELGANSSSPSTASGSIDRTTPTTHLEPTSASLKVRSTRAMDVLSEKKGSTADLDNATASPTSPLTMLSHLPSPAPLNSSKQHLNETKGYSGRNYTSENEAQKPDLEGVERGGWLFPVVFCSLFIFICCCTAFLTTGRCRKRSGRYKPRQRRASASRQFTRYVMVKNSF